MIAIFAESQKIPFSVFTEVSFDVSLQVIVLCQLSFHCRT